MVQQDVQQAWNTLYSTYDRFVIQGNMVVPTYLKCAELLLERYGADSSIQVLDVASSSGEPAITVAKAMPKSRIVSTDLVAGFKALGEARASAAGVTGVTFETADAEQLSGFSDATFDVVICSFGLMFMDVSVALAEFRRVLKKGGMLLCTIWNTLNEMKVSAFEQQLIKALMPDLPGNSMREGMSAIKLGQDLDGLCKAIQVAGFSSVAYEKANVDLNFSSTEDFFLLLTNGLGLPPAMEMMRQQGVADVEGVVKSQFEQLLASKDYQKEDGQIQMADNAYCIFTGEAV